MVERNRENNNNEQEWSNGEYIKWKGVMQSMIDE